ncbi:uncharacterized protein SOCE836_020550 [Sorangium cellulosum]|uniref:Uncharacterized protein n=1 Tax=Sorangium cellulosum TaxID=56 RepID=A0A4P2QJ46_SORCE|nr:uncharacterized protein SOCE836_020550 [Sorangium cellulosum]WCQ89349.1 hypothetical protein NQZ70_02036 [Sorangium sp. Soce836]
MMSYSLQGAVYVALGRIAQSELRKIVSPVVAEDDNILVGPSSAEPKRHRALRARRWGVEPSAELNKELADSDGKPICVALPPTIRGLLSFSRICASAAERGRQVFMMALEPDATLVLPQGPDPAVEAYIDVADALQRKPSVTRCSELEIALAATLWKLWCRRSPVAISRFCASGSALHPQLANLGRYHAGYFPRQTAQGLLLSRFDELLLRQLSSDWIAPVKVFSNGMRARSGLHAWLSHVGDYCVLERLLAWSRHDGGRVIECEEHPEKASELSRWSFRWRAGGEEILERLPSLQAAAPVSLGGAVAYDADRAWVCRFDVRGTPYVTRLATAQGAVGGRTAPVA